MTFDCSCHENWERTGCYQDISSSMGLLAQRIKGQSSDNAGIAVSQPSPLLTFVEAEVGIQKKMQAIIRLLFSHVSIWAELIIVYHTVNLLT